MESPLDDHLGGPLEDPHGFALGACGHVALATLWHRCTLAYLVFNRRLYLLNLPCVETPHRPQCNSLTLLGRFSPGAPWTILSFLHGACYAFNSEPCRSSCLVPAEDLLALLGSFSESTGFLVNPYLGLPGRSTCCSPANFGVSLMASFWLSWSPFRAPWLATILGFAAICHW